MPDSQYGEVFRDAYATLHGGRLDDEHDAPARAAGEALEAYLGRTRSEALGTQRARLLSADPPEQMRSAHVLLVDLLSNAMAADEALSEQVRAYQCGAFHESVSRSDQLQELILDSQRMDRELIAALRSLPAATLAALALDL